MRENYWIFSPEWGAKEKETTKQLAKLFTWQKHANGCNLLEDWKLNCKKHTKLMAPEYVRQGNGHWKQVSIQNTRFAIPEERIGWFVIPYENMVWHKKWVEYFDVDNWPNAKQRMAWQQSTVRTKHNILAPVNLQCYHHCQHHMCSSSHNSLRGISSISSEISVNSWNNANSANTLWAVPPPSLMVF